MIRQSRRSADDVHGDSAMRATNICHLQAVVIHRAVIGMDQESTRLNQTVQRRHSKKNQLTTDFAWDELATFTAVGHKR